MKDRQLGKRLGDSLESLSISQRIPDWVGAGINELLLLSGHYDMSQEAYDLMRATTEWKSAHCYDCDVELENRSEADAHRAMGCSAVLDLYDAKAVN